MSANQPAPFGADSLDGSHDHLGSAQAGRSRAGSSMNASVTASPKASKRVKRNDSSASGFASRSSSRLSTQSQSQSASGRFDFATVSQSMATAPAHDSRFLDGKGADRSMFKVDYESLQDFTVPGLQKASDSTQFKPGRGALGGQPEINAEPDYLFRNLTEVADGEDYDSLGLKTGEDVVEYFGRHSGNPDVKSVFLNRVPPSVSFRPYSLLVVSRTQTNPEYFTMSGSGVVHVQASRPSEFYRLGDWWQMSSNFKALRSIPFFKNFLTAKTAKLWNDNVRFRKYSQVRKSLKKKLFWGKPTFCNVLVELNRQCYEIRSSALMQYSTKSTHTHEQFSDAQVEQRNTSSKLFETVVDRVQSVLEKLCEEVSARVRPNEDGVMPLEEEASNAQQGRRGQKSKSLQQIRLDQLARKRALQVAFEEVEMLCSFIRLADYMVVESLMLVSLTSADELLQQLSNPPKRVGMFFNTCEFANDTVGVVPSAGVMQEMFANMMDQTVSTVHAVPRLLYMPCFHKHFQDEVMRGPNLSEMLRQSTTFQRICSGLDSIVVRDYGACLEYAQSFEQYRPIHTFCTSFDMEAFSQLDFLASSRTIKKEMLKLRQWGQDLERMKLGNVVGIFHVDSKQLRNELHSVRDQTLSGIKTVVHDAARETSVTVIGELQTAMKSLGRKPTTLKEFAAFVEDKQDISEGLRELLNKSTTVDDMYKLLTSFDVKVPAAEQVKLDDLHMLMGRITDHISEADGHISGSMQAMSSALNQSVQALNDELMQILHDLHSGPSNNATAPTIEVLEYLESVRDTVEQLAERGDTYGKYSELFKLPPMDDSNVQSVRELFASRLEVWESLANWEQNVETWENSDWSTLNPEDMQKEVQITAKGATKLWKANEEDKVALRYKDAVDVWRGRMPVLLDLGNPAIKDRHWDQIFAKLGVERPSVTTLGNWVAWNVFDIKDYVGEVSGVAAGEYALELQLEKIESTWADLEFQVNPYREYKDVFILAGIDEIFAAMEDNQAALQTMLASRFVVGIREQVETWDKTLSTLSETLDEWLTCQRNWMYLESIFGAPDIQKQLPAETIKFQRVDQQWKDIMKKTNKRPNVVGAACAPGVLTMFSEANESLEQIQKSLEDYLETKRMGFPRFYFLSNDELLEILSQTRDPTAVKPHLRKCFDFMASVDFAQQEIEGNNVTSIVLMESAEGERVNMSEPVQTVGNVEFWMVKLEDMMRKTLYDHGKACLDDYTEDGREAWFFKWPAQSVLTVDQIVWQVGVTAALNSISDGSNANALKSFKDFNVEQIGRMVNVVRGKLSSIQRGCVCNLIVIDVHARDVLERMIKEDCSSTTDFAWISQLRYYWDGSEEVNDCVVRQTNAWFIYGYEYLGVVPRLVITPLTDKCFMTLTGALNLVLGGAPAGPAGTGKTESVKDLGKALARQCVVFNCSDGLDYKMMGRFFSGLAQAGAWACFDEFNRIDIEVLSVIAQQILTIQQALKGKVERFMFEGREIRANANYGAFITMNPGYAGRTELPDNLKALFRPMAMMVPDYALIAEIMLFSEGFGAAKDLARKMATMYRLASEQLSSQDHYDFGMRAVKSVLVMAGSLKRSQPDVAEDVTLIRAMRDSNVPKFLADDIPLFLAIVRDLFPGVEVPKVDYGHLKKAIEDDLTGNKLQIVDPFVGKIIQLYETMNVRHGVMLVGVTATGKTTVSTTLANSLTALNEQAVSEGKSPDELAVQRFTLNPKSITMGELYGEFNLQTNEWTDGLIATIVRQGVAATDEARKWVICDGPVDAIWIESMNTVLDDNKTLCLNNGERIKLPKTMSMVFEVNDLAVASPATVSRCGMVYLEPVYLGWRPLAVSWASNVIDARFPELGLGQSLLEMIDSTVEKALKFFRRECTENVPTVDINLVCSLLNLIDSMLVETQGVTIDNAKDVLKFVFSFCFVWALGGNADDNSTSKFSDFCSLALKDVCSLPTEGSVYDYCVDIQGLTWAKWNDRVEEFKYSSELPFFDLIVPTVDTTRIKFLARAILEGSHHILVTGNSGVGKTVMVLDHLLNAGEGFTAATKNFSAQTSAANLQAFLEEKLEKLRKNLLGPPSGKRIVFFVDDLNMPQKETYGAQPPIELLRQIISQDDKQGGFYDRKKIGLFKKVKDTLFAAACCPPGGGRSDVTPRFLRHFHIVNVANLSTSSMQHIFSSILSGFLGSFSEDQQNMSNSMIEASIDLYTKIASELLPTPAKSHYTFNLRDLSKVVQGILMVEAKHVSTPDDLVRLWIHELNRVFRDRLINEDDREWFNRAIEEQLSTKLSRTWPAADFARVMYTDFLTQGGNGPYLEVNDFDKCNKVLLDYAEDYTLSTNKPMSLVFFRDAIEHVSRISRVLRQPRGNVLLVGVGGSGRQSLARLASHAADYKCFQIELTRGYGVNDFHEDLKKMLMHAGCKDSPTTFLFSDTQLVKESFLEDINNILNAGEVPDLFARDEVDKIVEECRGKAKAAGKMETRDAIYQHFVTLVRENLHVVLAMSPVGDEFRNRLRMFPSLVNCCTIDWYTEWPEDALVSVAERFMENVDLGDDDMKAAVCMMCNKIHSSVASISRKFLDELRRNNYTTPTSYLELINLYLAMLGEQRESNTQKIDRYQGGVDKLITTNEMVESLKVDLQKLKPVLAQAAKDTAKLLTEVEADKVEAGKVEDSVQKETVKVNAAAAEAKEIKDDAQKDLDEALPAFESAVQSLRSLNKGDITEIKSFAKPPPLVQTVMEGVCLLKGVKPSWDDAKKLLGDTNFLSSLEQFDKDNIPEKTIKKLQPYIKNPDFLPETVEKVSKAAKSLCMWVRAMDTYARIAKNVEPKRKALEAAEASLAEMNAMLAEKQSELAKVQARVQELENKLSETLQQRDDLQKQSDETTARLERAEQLISGLGGEKVRWEASLEQLEKDRVNLVGNILVAAGCIAYAGPFTAAYRKTLIDQWVQECKKLKIPADPGFSLQRIVGDPVQMRTWGIQGLPQDELSLDNGIIMTRGRRWPLLIDPQMQANRWIRNMERPNHLQVIKLTEATYLRTLENSIRVGNPVLLENVEEKLDPALEPILLKQVFKSGGRMLIRLGDTDVDYNSDFKFYVTSKLPNPHYAPEVQVKVTLVNFTVTPKGLEDQLLSQVVGFERPELEEEKGKLVVQIADGQKQLSEIEDKILYMLANSTGNILDDEVLIATLAASKTTSEQINAQVAQAEETKTKIDEACEGYRPVATRGSILYFVVANMGGVDPMYQYSLQYFIKLFNLCMEKSEVSDDLETRVATLIKVSTEEIYANVCRGLFEKDKKMFSFSIAVQIMRNSGAITEAEWAYFLTKGGMVDEASLPANPCSEWMKTDIWGALQHLENIDGFAGLSKSIADDSAAWNEWFMCNDPVSTPLPGGWVDKLSAFKQLLVLRTLREEKVVSAVTNFILTQIGKQFVESPPFDLKTSFADSSTTTPVIFVLSPGADPMSYLLALADDMGMRDRLRMISLGQGQGPIAQKMIEAARDAGEWVCLQNCHLAISWMPDLERLLEAQNTMKLHDDFRLWLTSMPSKAFPVSVLQNGIKLTDEPPKGLRANIKRTFEDMTEKQFTACSRTLPWQKMLFGLAFFHAVVQERRKFGPLGWNIPYEWNNSDLLTAIANLRMYIDEQENVPYQTLQYVLGDVNYGGRVTDYLDQRCVRSILIQYFNPSVLEDGHTYTKDGVYRPPPVGDLESFRAFVNDLPLTDSPEVFGLHNNAAITFDQKETRYLIDTIISVQPRTGGGAGGKSSDEIVAEVAQDIANKLPSLLTREGANEETFKEENGAMNSMGTFLLIEMGKFNKLLKRMKSTLNEIQRAIKGLVVMSSDLEGMYQAFLFQKVPGLWGAVAPLSLKPLGSWVKDLIARVEFVKSWIANGPPPSFWMSAFFFPQGFMTAALQTYARRHEIAIDTLDFRTEVQDSDMEDIVMSPENGVYVYGLFMEGARWCRESNSIVESNPSQLFTSVPVVWLDPQNLADRKESTDIYPAPLYKVSSRAGTLSTTGHSTNFVRILDMPTNVEPEHWIRRGVALLSQLDD